MTINEIERKINSLTKLLENEKRKVEENKDQYRGKYYKISNNQIGKIKGYYKIPNIYTCDELFFDTEYNEISNDAEERRSISELEIISKDEFEKLLDEIFMVVKEKF